MDRPIIFSAPMVLALLAGRKTQTRRILKPPHGIFEITAGGEMKPIPRHFAPGDRLWVREAWRTWRQYDDVPPSGLEAGTHVAYEATPQAPNLGSNGGRPRASIHMPRWASRMTLGVTEVRVQRLQEISEEDAGAEGVGDPYLGDGDPPYEEHAVTVTRKMQFRNLWNSLHGADAWDASPWVGAVSFTVEQRNIDQ